MTYGAAYSAAVQGDIRRSRASIALRCRLPGMPSARVDSTPKTSIPIIVMSPNPENQYDSLIMERFNWI